jgi:hypothetical protein
MPKKGVAMPMGRKKTVITNWISLDETSKTLAKSGSIGAMVGPPIIAIRVTLMMI